MRHSPLINLAAAAALIGLAWSCTQTIIPVSTGSTTSSGALGGGGAGGMSSSSSSGFAGGCDAPAPVGALDFCGGSVGAGAGSPFMCETDVCTETQTYVSLCTVDGCDCLYEGEVACSCTFPTPGDGCSGNTCCPAPFPDT